MSAGLVGAVAAAPRFFERMTDARPRATSPTTSEDLEFLRSLGVRSAITVALRARGQADRRADPRRRLVGRRYRAGGRRFRLGPLRPGRADPRQRRPLLRPRAGRSRRGRRSPRRCSAACCRRRCPTSRAGRSRRSYRPAGAENEVGGDFYDAFPAAGGWMLVIGDVTGRGARAASVTAQARYTLRTAAALTGDPLVALATLNRALLARGDSALCSVAALAISRGPAASRSGSRSPATRRRCWSTARRSTEIAGAGPVLGAFADADWALDYAVVEPGQQLVVVTDGIAEACGQDGRFGEERLRAELGGAASPVQAVQRLEGALQSFTGGSLEDDVAILALAPASAESRAAGLSIARQPAAGAAGFGAAMDDSLPRAGRAPLRRLQPPRRRGDRRALRRGDGVLPGRPPSEVGREAPYVGAEGLRDYLDDVATVWEELLITPERGRAARRLAPGQGRVYLRSRALGIRDMPAAWIWELREGRFVRGEVFADPEEAVQAVRPRSVGQEPAVPLALVASRSTTRLR